MSDSFPIRHNVVLLPKQQTRTNPSSFHVRPKRLKKGTLGTQILVNAWQIKMNLLLKANSEIYQNQFTREKKWFKVKNQRFYSKRGDVNAPPSVWPDP